MEREAAPQAIIETEIKRIVDLGNFEGAFLFSSEGLPLAQVSNASPYQQEDLLEISLNLGKTLTQVSEVREVIILDRERRKLVFRFFHAFEEPVVLAIVVPPGKVYRAYTNKIIRVIKKLGGA